MAAIFAMMVGSTLSNAEWALYGDVTISMCRGEKWQVARWGYNANRQYNQLSPARSKPGRIFHGRVHFYMRSFETPLKCGWGTGGL